MKKYNKVCYDYSHLKGRITERYRNAKNFCAASGISEATISRKLNNRRYFSQNEIKKISELLGITDNEIGIYFFSRLS